MTINFYHDGKCIIQKFNIPVPRLRERLVINNVYYRVYDIEYDFDIDCISVTMSSENDTI